MTNFLISKGHSLLKSLLKATVSFGMMLAVFVSGSIFLLGSSQPAIALSNPTPSYQIAAASDVVRERAKDEFEDKTSPEARQQLEKAIQDPQGKVRHDLNQAQRTAERAFDALEDKAEDGIDNTQRAAERAKDRAGNLFD